MDDKHKVDVKNTERERVSVLVTCQRWLARKYLHRLKYVAQVALFPVLWLISFFRQDKRTDMVCGCM